MRVSFSCFYCNIKMSFLVHRAQRGEQERGGSVTKPDNIVLSSEVAPNYLEAQVLEIQLKTQ